MLGWTPNHAAPFLTAVRPLCYNGRVPSIEAGCHVMITDQPTLRAASRRPRRLLSLAASVLAMAVILYFLGRVLFRNWEQVQQHEWKLDLPLLALSFVGLIGSYVVDIAVWRSLIMRMGERIAFRQALRLYFAAGLAKYVPGTVWQFLGWFYLAQKEGIGRIIAGTSIILCQALSALAGALLALAALASTGIQDVAAQLLLVVLIIPIGLVFLQPRLVAAVLNWGLARLGRQPLVMTLTFRDLASIFVFYLGSYVLWGLALFLFTNALTPLPFTSFAPFLGVFPAAYALGLIAPFAPAGLGVREGTLTYLLSFFVPLPIATVIALLTRPWMMAVEIIGAALALASYARQGDRPGAPRWER